MWCDVPRPGAADRTAGKESGLGRITRKDAEVGVDDFFIFVLFCSLHSTGNHLDGSCSI
jgi:hypothetical protein